MSTLDVTTIVDRVKSHAAALGIFERTLSHEPKSAPGYGLTFAVWSQKVTPIPARSGLASTSYLVLMNVRMYGPMLQDPMDEIDPNMLRATDSLMADYNGAFTLDGAVTQVDLLGAYGTKLTAEAGYINIDGKLMRVMTVDLPLVVDDLYQQVA